MQTLTFAAVNFEANFGHITENLNRMETWVRKLAAQGAQVIGFPEMSACGYDRSEAILPYYLPVDLDPTPIKRIRSSKMGYFLPNRQPNLYKGLIDDNHQKTRKDRT